VQAPKKEIPKLQIILELLTAGEALPASYRDHNLTGNYVTRRECHIEPDWLLIYRVNEEEKLIELVRTGSHSELFSKAGATDPFWVPNRT